MDELLTWTFVFDSDDHERAARSSHADERAHLVHLVRGVDHGATHAGKVVDHQNPSSVEEQQHPGWNRAARIFLNGLMKKPVFAMTISREMLWWGREVVFCSERANRLCITGTIR